jgi:hypothetical protein
MGTKQSRKSSDQTSGKEVKDRRRGREPTGKEQATAWPEGGRGNMFSVAELEIFLVLPVMQPALPIQIV